MTATATPIRTAAGTSPRIAALVPNVLNFCPGQRVRIESWAQFLPQYGWDVQFYPFEDDQLHAALYSSGRHLAKMSGMLRCYLRQLQRVMAGPRADVLFIYREAALIGPAFIERLAKRWRVPIVMDIDDPIFLPYRSPTNGWFSLLKFHHKTYSLFRMSDHVIAINRLIGDHVARYQPAVTTIPNWVDTEHFRPGPDRSGEAPRVVWIGSRSTMPNLAALREPIRRLQASHGTPLRVIGVGDVDLPGINVEFRPWSAATEVAELQQADIGLVPVPDAPWNEWKFFLKTIQYLAVGLPVVARRMGSNSEVIQDGVNGFVVETDDEWYDRLRLLVEDAEVRRRMGIAARQSALEHYSVDAQMPRVHGVFSRALGVAA